MFFLFCLFFTVKREVAEEGGEQVHDEHGQDGDVCHVLHALLGSTGVEEKKQKKKSIWRSTQCQQR